MAHASVQREISPTGENPTSVRDDSGQPHDTTKDRARRRRRILWIAIFSVALLAGIAVAIVYFMQAAKYETTDDAFIDAHVSQIAPQVAGRVERVLIVDNQSVQAGQLLLTLDERDYKVALERAQAGLAAARAQLGQANAAKLASAAQVEQVAADIAAANAKATLAHSEFRRTQRLVASGALSTAAQDSARSAERSNDAAVLGAREHERAGQALQQQAEAQLETAQAGVRSAEAALDQAQLQLSYTAVRAPVAGRITLKQVEPGDYVQLGQQVLSIVQPDVWVTANFKETQLDQLRRGQPVTIRIDAYPGRTWRGHVDSFQRGTGARFSLLPPENATGNYVKVVQRLPVKIVFDHPREVERAVLAPGMSVEPKVFVAADSRMPVRKRGVHVAQAAP